MDAQRPFSHGLLYSVPPQNFSSLHLQDEERMGEFEWSEFKTVFAISKISECLASLLKR